MIRAMVDSITKVIDDTRAAVSPSYAENRSRLRSEVEAEEKRRHRELMKANQRRADLLNLMESESGRRVVWQLLIDCKYQGGSWTPDQRLSDHLASQRDIAVKYAGELVMVSVPLWLKMQDEAYQDAQRDQ